MNVLTHKRIKGEGEDVEVLGRLCWVEVDEGWKFCLSLTISKHLQANYTYKENKI